MRGLLAAAERFAAAATPARLALSLLAVLTAYGLVALVHAPLEAAIRDGACAGLDCLRPTRPDTRQGGYGPRSSASISMPSGGCGTGPLSGCSPTCR